MNIKFYQGLSLKNVILKPIKYLGFRSISQCESRCSHNLFSYRISCVSLRPIFFRELQINECNYCSLAAICG